MSVIDRIEAAAAAWEGTAFAQNGAVRGGGVTCHLLCFSVYYDAGWLPALDTLHVPIAPVNWSQTQTHSLMEEYFDQGEGRNWFTRIADLEDRRPGDLLGFKLGHCIHHLAVVLRGGRLVSCVEHIGVRISPCLQTPWAKRLRAIWRPRFPT